MAFNYGLCLIILGSVAFGFGLWLLPKKHRSRDRLWCFVIALVCLLLLIALPNT